MGYIYLEWGIYIWSGVYIYLERGILYLEWGIYIWSGVYISGVGYIYLEWGIYIWSGVYISGAGYIISGVGYIYLHGVGFIYLEQMTDFETYGTPYLFLTPYNYREVVGITKDRKTVP